MATSPATKPPTAHTREDTELAKKAAIIQDDLAAQLRVLQGCVAHLMETKTDTSFMDAEGDITKAKADKNETIELFDSPKEESHSRTSKPHKQVKVYSLHGGCSFQDLTDAEFDHHKTVKATLELSEVIRQPTFST